MARVYLLFRSTHDTLKAEAVLRAAGLPGKVVQKPAGIRMDCGLAVRTEAAAREEAVATLTQAGQAPRGVFEL